VRASSTSSSSPPHLCQLDVERGRAIDHITFHSTRHTFASHYLEGGAVSDLKEILGHSNLKTTEIYAKAVDVRTRASVEALDYGLDADSVRDAGNGRT